jgi:adenylosuccinate lyase
VIERYARPAMAELWTDAARYARWLEVELAAADVLAERGVVPREAAAALRRKAGFDPARIDEIERRVRHDVIAFLTDVAEQVGPEARWLHYGMTSSDTLDTALALQVRDAGRLLLDGVDRAAAALEARAREHRGTPMVGRTHGVHGEPTTFGLKLLVFWAELRRQRARLARALDEAAVGKLSGAVGTCAHLEPAVEEAVCARLGIGFEPAATQIVQRDRHAHLVCALALVASSLDKFAVEFRHLARTEVREVEEEFGAGQKGSSAMPHKRNPWRFENVSGLARVVRGHAVAALENQALWHERDMSNSSVERIVLPDAFQAVDFMLHRFAGLVEGLVVFPERMRKNLELTGGLVFSGTLLLELAKKGLSREDAYARVQDHAMAVWKASADGAAPPDAFQKRIAADPRIAELLSREDLARVFDLGQALRNVDAIFERTLREGRA